MILVNIKWKAKAEILEPFTHI